jgi:pyruvate dehydrogenase E2 component (dihydrolipoamide acetyltransferase)
MPFEIRVPRLGWSMETGVFVRWLKANGDTVRVGEALYELEGEKATQEIEAVDAGVLRIPPDAPLAGSEVAVGALLGYLTGDNEPIPRDVTVSIEAPSASHEPERRESSLTTNAAVVERSRIVATPRARRIGEEVGVDWKALEGTGRNGRIRECDVRSAGTKTPGASASGSLGRRKTIAQRMLASSQQTAPVTLTTRADATHLVSLRQQFKATGGLTPSYTDIVAKLTAVALSQHPVMAGGPATELNIGMAVDTKQGLVVPVLRNVAGQSLMHLAAQSQELVEKARAGKLSADDMSGGVFTITNLGNYGIDAFTPIINLPQTAILGLGAVRREAVVLEDDRIVPRDQITLSLTFDHRLVDGAPAARFLQTLVAAVENPSAWLLS